MLPSMFNLDQRIAELHQVADDVRTERRFRDAVREAGHDRLVRDGLQRRPGSSQAPRRPNRLATY